ncbi:hypothetical protein QBC43DRAFT_67731 [Cladorrhinum sp. PSN259]|nr:hypothetical protein QBC43DRAFT_67731 [Cladorrhinum sp. PSN259]
MILLLFPLICGMISLFSLMTTVLDPCLQKFSMMFFFCAVMSWDSSLSRGTERFLVYLCHVVYPVLFFLRPWVWLFCSLRFPLLLLLHFFLLAPRKQAGKREKRKEKRECNEGVGYVYHQKWVDLTVSRSVRGRISGLDLELLSRLKNGVTRDV